MFNIYSLFLDSTFIILNGEPQGYKTKVAEYILKRIEMHKTRSEIVTLLNLSFETLIVGNRQETSHSLNFIDFNKFYEKYETQGFDFVIFEEIPQLSESMWIKLKEFSMDKGIQCLFIGPHIDPCILLRQDLSVFAHYNSYDHSVDIVFPNSNKKTDFLLNSFYI